jgi:hypothetical protein
VIGDLAVEERLPGGWTWVNYAALIERDRVELLPIGEPSTAQDLSDTGLVVGALRNIGIESRGFVFDLATGELQAFDPLGDQHSLFLRRINASGTVAVGEAVDGRGQARLMVLFVNERRLVDLSSLVDVPANFLLMHAISVNVHGQILVTAHVVNDDYDDDWEADLILTPE